MGCGLTLLHTTCHTGALFSHKAGRGGAALSGSLDKGTNPIPRGSAFVVCVLLQEILFLMLFKGSAGYKEKSHHSPQPSASSVAFGTQNVNMPTSSGINVTISGQLTPF